MALETPPTVEALSVEQRKAILSNRALTYIRFGDIYTALADCDRALSEYTTPDSPKALTAKCHLRRADVLCKMSRYDEAESAYEAFEGL